MFLFLPRSASLPGRYPPLYLIPVLVVLLLKELQPTTGETPVITGACRNRCEENRPKGKEGDFKFNCKEVYKSEEDQQKCRDDCELCPKQVCDETANKYGNVDTDTANDWHCPKGMNEICFNHCQQNRPKGSREGYTLDCDTAYSTNAERQDCKNKCSECPSYVCQQIQPNIFNCPYEKMNRHCEKQCDKVRVYGELGPISFDCRQKYSNPVDQKTCELTCKKHCPAWVCDASDANQYSCPSIRIEKTCLDYCKERRAHLKLGSEAFDVDCAVESSNSCDRGCDECKFSSDADKGPLCSSEHKDPFKCPPQEPDEKEIWPSEKTYKGACKDRCDESRSGGIDPFTLACSTTYTTDEERSACKEDCRECDGDGFKVDGCFSYDNEHHIKCEGTPSYQMDKAEKERQYHERFSEEMRNEEKLKADEKKLKAIKKSDKDFEKFAVIGIVVGLIVFCVLFGGLLCLMYRMKKNRNQGQSVNIPGSGEPGLGGGGSSTLGALSESGAGIVSTSSTLPDEQVPSVSQTQMQPSA